jgi:hypothetical protein
MKLKLYRLDLIACIFSFSKYGRPVACYLMDEVTLELYFLYRLSLIHELLLLNIRLINKRLCASTDAEAGDTPFRKKNLMDEV